MGLFHCPMGAPYYDDDACIDCGLCSATTKEEMVEASKKIREYLSSHAGRKSAVRRIAVTGKGGTGKSTLVVLLANALKRRGHDVLVLDADESNPGLNRLLGFDNEPEPLISMLGRVTGGGIEAGGSWLGRDRIESSDIPPEYVLEDDNLRFMMVGKLNDPFQGCACSFADITREFVARLALDDKEVLLVDTEAGIESFGRGVERSVDTVLIVVEPSFESLALAEKIAYMAEGMGISRVEAVLNKVSSEKVAQRMEEQLDIKSIKYLGTIYLDDDVSDAGFEGRTPRGSKAGQDADTIAARLLDE